MSPGQGFLSATRGLALAGLLLAGTPGTANAYCRTHTCQADSDCTTNDDGCPVGGKPLFWPSRCISYSVQRDGSPLRGITATEAESALALAYQTWTEVDCGRGELPSIEVFQFPQVECGQVEFNECDENANIWVFRDGQWPYDDGGRTLAQTWVHFDIRTGEIFDADVEVNTAQMPITTRSEAERSQFIAIATHEIGHVLGLDHTPESDATMYASYNARSSISDLTIDDVEGLCAIYPPGRDVGACDPEPYNGFSTKCGTIECDDGGCRATTPGRTERNGSWAAFAVGLGLVLARARRRRRRG